MDGGQLMGGLAVAISAITAIIAAVNHKRIRSNCCGKPIVVSVDIENTTPQQPPQITSPPSLA